jgi:Tfp pilus assembly pilus retraction ATPase PilT
MEQEGWSHLNNVIAESAERRITDLHLTTDCVIKCRVGGWLAPFQAKGQMLEVDKSDMAQTVAALGFTAGRSGMIMFREYGIPTQIRAIYLANDPVDSLKLRLLSAQPEPLDETIGLQHWLNPSSRSVHTRGLILITGSLGSGKTTLASSLVQRLSQTGRHIMTIEDPIEYIIASPPEIGSVTQLECDIHSIHGDSPNKLSFQQALQFAYRSDHNGMFISECRRPEVFREVAELSTTNVPIITTLHAGDIADAIIRVTSMLSQTLNEDVARTLLSQGLHSVWHTSMAYAADNTPIPVVACLPLYQRHSYQTRIFSEYNPQTMRDTISNALVAAKGLDDAITYDEAFAKASARGATEESLAFVRSSVKDFLTG